MLIWPINGTLTGTTTQDQSWSGNKENEENSKFPKCPERSVIMWSFSAIYRALVLGVLALCRDIVEVFYSSPSHLSDIYFSIYHYIIYYTVYF